MSLQVEKDAARERIWSAMIAARICPADARGHIPYFTGSDRAAELLASTDAWQRSHTLKSNPDKAQLPVRARALAEGRLLYMAVPRIATMEPFYRIDLIDTAQLPEEAALSETAAQVSPRTRIDEMPHIDLVVC